MKDGRPGASLIDLTLSDGSVLPHKAAGPNYE
jgi:hypothetical protein